MWNQHTTGAAGGFAPGGIAGPSAAGSTGWHPTVVYMLALVVVEIVGIGIVSRRLLE